jgi:hypothetical protein
MKYKFASLFFVCVHVLTGTQQLWAQAPAINSFTPASGYVGSLVTINGSNMSNPTAVTIGGVSAIIISATKTQLVAMVMPTAITGSVSVTNASGMATGLNNFIVSNATPPVNQPGNKLYGANTENTVNPSEQGFSVAMSADGNTAVVGGDFDSGDVGAVWVFTRSNNGWIQQGNKLVGTGAVSSTPAQGIL